MRNISVCIISTQQSDNRSIFRICTFSLHNKICTTLRHRLSLRIGRRAAGCCAAAALANAQTKTERASKNMISKKERKRRRLNGEQMRRGHAALMMISVHGKRVELYCNAIIKRKQKKIYADSDVPHQSTDSLSRSFANKMS